MEGSMKDGGMEEGWRGGSGTEGGRALSLFIVLCCWVVLVVSLLCGLIVMPSFCVLIVLSSSCIVVHHCRMSLG